MHWLKTTAVVMMLALWSVASNHCQLETLPGLSFLECAPATSTGSHCDDTECAGVESSGFKVENHQSLIPAAILTIDLAQIILPLDELATDSSTGMLPTTASSELPRCWQFVFRTAAPPRAPSFVS